MSRGRYSSTTSREDCAQPPPLPDPSFDIGGWFVRERSSTINKHHVASYLPGLHSSSVGSLFFCVRIDRNRIGRVTWFCLWSADQGPVVRKEADSFAPDPSHRLVFPRQQSRARCTKPEPLDLRGAFRAPFSPLGGPTTGLIIAGSTRRSKFKTNTHIAKQTTRD